MRCVSPGRSRPSRADATGSSARVRAGALRRLVVGRLGLGGGVVRRVLPLIGLWRIVTLSALFGRVSSGRGWGQTPDTALRDACGEIVTLSPPLLVVVTGAPAAGKTTLARALAGKLGLPLIAKDDIKETLFDALGVGDREWSRRLGRATFDVQFRVLDELLEAGCSVVAEGNFSAAEPFGALPPARIVQVFCSAPRQILLERFRQRTDRHPGHVDDVTLQELGARLSADEWPVLAIGGELVVVDTTSFTDGVDPLVERVRRVTA